MSLPVSSCRKRDAMGREVREKEEEGGGGRTETALHMACQEGQEHVVGLLLQAGANAEQKTKVKWGHSQD